MLNAVLGIAIALGIVMFLFGLFKLLFVPLAVYFEIAAARRRRRDAAEASALARHVDAEADQPLVSVVIPAYNESRVLRNCVHSILACDYPNIEVILVDDGSLDDTRSVMAELAAQADTVRFLTQPNAGKGAALNRGIRQATGDILIFIDADSVFSAGTIDNMLRGFTDPKVGAVCGDDRPVNVNTLQTRLLTLLSHLGTGLVRRALSVMRCLPIVSGNSGAFRRDVLEETGYFDTDTLGEDLELTWRVYQAGYRVRFAPRALVYAESPATISGLWKQRVRWARGLLQTTWKHRSMIGNLRYGVFGAFLLVNTITMILIPVVQILVLVLVFGSLGFGDRSLIPVDWFGWLAWLGLGVTLVLVVIGVALNRAWPDLRHLWTLPFAPVYSLFVGFTMVVALWQQGFGMPARWNKLERTGVISPGSRVTIAPTDTTDTTAATATDAVPRRSATRRSSH